MKTIVLTLLVLAAALSLRATTQTIELLPGEQVFSGAIKEGHLMPFRSGYTFDFYANNQYNQLQPLLLGTRGLWVWSEEPFSFEIQEGKILVSSARGTVESGRAGTTLAHARAEAARRFFPASGKLPDELLFSRPQYNTWIELTYNQNQSDVLRYAQAILDNGFEPGVIMIDDTWQEDYGLWDFHPGRFPQPKQMVDKLHAMGFKVMVWVCPFVSGDQAIIVRQLMKDRAFLMQRNKDADTWETATTPASISWWNGYSLLLDFTNPAAVRWFDKQLDHLVAKYGIDGFKFDAGDMHFYPPDALSMVPATPNRHCELYAHFGLRFPLNEYRAGWKMAGLPLAQRLHDKFHTWEDVQKLIPHMLTEGLSGYTFACPDMIGGGDYVSFLDNPKMDQTLVVRSAQIHALMPMMQFSVAPWRILDKPAMEAIKRALTIRKEHTPHILRLAQESAKTGEPIVRSMEYCFPGQGFEHIRDQFVLGATLIVAPMVHPGSTREVVLPAGKWIDDKGAVHEGGRTIHVEVPLDRLPFFVASAR